MSRLAYASISLLAYTYVGYPAIVAALSRLRPMDVERDDAWTPTVSVLIPVYNAKSYVRPKLESLLRQSYPKEKLQILVYSDGSTDGSDLEVEDFAREVAARDPSLAGHVDAGQTDAGRIDAGHIELVRATERKGKPTALNVMRQKATGEVLILTDIRQVLSDNAIRELVSLLADPRVGTVSGNLELVGGTGAGAYWKYENFIRACEARYRGMVGVTGPLYAIRASDLPEVPTDIILDDMWIPLRLRLQGKRLLFAKDAIALDDAFEDDREKGRKVRTLAGNFQLFSMVPELLSPLTNPSFFETFSHKVLRLAGPVLMAGTLGGTLLGLARSKSTLEKGALSVLLAGQGAFALLAIAGKSAGKAGQLARTFVVLNGAAVEGFVRFARQKQEVTW